MPELPEVETVARTLYPHIQNCVFTSVDLLRKSTLHPLSLPLKSLEGMTIKDTGRRGKLLLLELGNDAENFDDAKRPSFLVAHLRMTGRLFTTSANKEQGGHTRCIFHLRKPGGEPINLFFDDTRAFGKILVATPKILEQWDFWRTLGPEPLTLNAKNFAERLLGNRAIKAALLDQKVIAGIGNIYADEALFQAGIHPLRTAASLNKTEQRALLDAIKDVLKRSISQCGSSIRDYRDADGNVGAFQNTFMAYGRGGQACKKCGHAMTRTKVGGRATVFCPFCQKLV